MAKISETELQKRLRKLEASISDPSDTVALTDDQYTLTENVIYVAYASALSNLTDGTIPNQSDATDFQYSPYNIAGILMQYRGYFSSTSIYPSGDPTDYLWESTTGLSGFESSERYYTTSSGFRKSLGNPTEPGDGVTWTVITAGNAVPGTAIWLAERYTVSGITSGWSITSVAAYVNEDLLIDDSVTGAKIADNAIDSEHYTDASIDNAHLADDAVGVAELSATGTASSSTFLRGDNAWAAPAAVSTATSSATGVIKIEDDTDQSVAAESVSTTANRTYGLQLNSSDQGVVNVPWTDTNTTYSVQDGELSQINFTSADHTKLDGIETSADVTDTTNVTAAGALMDSEVTNLADVKAIDQSLISGASPTFGTLNATTVDLGDWTITETGGVLFFATSGVNKMKLEASGNLTCVGTVTESGSM